jgi:tetratricopeptide (TPR) repeat protein
LLPFVFVSLVCATVTWAAQAQLGAVPTLASVPVSQRLDNAFVAYERYVLKTFIPVDLCASYVRSTAWPLWQVAGAIALCTALTWWTWRARRKNLWLLFGWCWFVLTLLPNIGLIQAGPQSMADRYTYLPLVGIFLMAAGAIGGERREMRCSWAVNLLGFAALALCSALSFQQVKYWKDGVALFGRAVAIDKSNWVAQLGLGMALTQERRFDEALGHLHRALALPGNAAEAERRLGICYGYKGEPEVAIGHFRESLKLNSGSAETHLLLARLLTAPGRTDAEAQEGAELVGRGLALRREISSEDWMSAAAVYQRAEWWKEADIAARRAGRAGG